MILVLHVGLYQGLADGVVRRSGLCLMPCRGLGVASCASSNTLFTLATSVCKRVDPAYLHAALTAVLVSLLDVDVPSVRAVSLSIVSGNCYVIYSSTRESIHIGSGNVT
jgi:hypothetical protein